MSIAIVFGVFSGFASPLALNRILSYAYIMLYQYIYVLILIRYIESNGQGASISPWFWILCLFFGPIIMSISFQWYIFMGTRALALTEGLLTQLVFEHSLRIRFKAEGSKENRPLAVQSASPTPTSDTQSVEGSTAHEDSDTQSDTMASSTKGKTKADSTTKSAVAKDEKKDNLVGKLNTLVTVDLENIVGAKDFLMVGKERKMSTIFNFDR